ncbi:hypothetical protein ZP13_25510 [Salmonella enterica subsp. enterica]|nr:hypothetical protein [Salmonella enterica subsp. enterica]ECE0941511.1 hypothetical protein [Salmonella enterica subsp. enterica]ECI2262670.1 hypothetical protein [Salmonella enterica subsp. enterica]
MDNENVMINNRKKVSERVLFMERGKLKVERRGQVDATSVAYCLNCSGQYTGYCRVVVCDVRDVRWDALVTFLMGR